jgi:di/tricarboxylate transporter
MNTGPGLARLSTAAQVLLAILPLLAIILLFVLVFFFLYWEYRKQKLLIERGGAPVRSRLDEKVLLIGIVSLFVGVGLTVFFVLYSGVTGSLLGGLIPATAGLGVLTYFLLTRRPRG